MPEKPFTLLRRPLAVWLAVLVALFGAIAPTLSHALVQGGAAAVDICTSTGPRGVAPGQAQEATPRTASASSIPADSPDGQESAFVPDPCPFCLPATDRAVPASCALAFLVVVPGDPGEPTIWQAFFFFNHFSLTPPPRGPPPFSLPFQALQPGA